MRLACQHELHRHIRIVNQAAKAIDVLEQEESPFVGRKPPGESYRENLRIEHFIGHFDVERAGAATGQLVFQPLAGEKHQSFAPSLMYAP